MASPSDLAWDRFLIQHQNKPNTERFVKAFYKPIDDATYSIDQLLQLRSLSKATGKQLDGIGEIVGLSRLVEEGAYGEFFGFSSQPAGRNFGLFRMRRKNEPWAFTTMLPDEELRVSLRGKIAQNNGHGTAKEIEDIAKILFDVEYAYVRDAGPAEIILYIGRPFSASYPGYRLYSYLLPVALGVSITPVYWDGGVSKYPAALLGVVA